MKVGVITYSNSKDNYGQLLQCYAMQQYLKIIGHESFLIRYQEAPQIDRTGFKFKNLLAYVGKFPVYIKWYVNEKRRRYNKVEYEKAVDFHKRNFAGFLSERIKMTGIYTLETIHSNPPHADAYICGSDQIWGGDDDVYFLSFAPDNAIKIAYAPSMGGASYSDKTATHLRKYMARLDLIGMREQSGVDVCHRMGFDKAVKVVDPTMLLNGSAYRSISKEPIISKPYAFVYLLGNPIDITIQEIEEYVQSKGLKMIYVASQGRNDNHEKIDPTIEEWLGWIAQSNLVITNSFHCTVFALQFHRNFITIPLSGGYARMNTRIAELLNECGLGSRFAFDAFPENILQDDDFMQFENYREQQCNISAQFLNILNR